MPKVSIILPFYNAEKHIEETLESLENQTEQDFEVIAVNDGSTDTSLAIVEEWQDRFKRLKIVRLTKNLGPGNARNEGIHVAESDLIALVDADDTWEPEKLEVQLKEHERTGCLFSCIGFRYGGMKLTRAKTDYKSLLKNNVINTSSVMFDNSALGLSFQNTEKASDYIEWLSVSKKTDIRFIDKLLVTRRTNDGISSNKLKMARMRWRIYRQHERLSLPKAMFYTVCYALNGIVKNILRVS